MTNSEKLLKQVLLNQAVIYKKLCKIEDKISNKLTSKGDLQYKKELIKLSEKMKEKDDDTFKIY